MNLEEMTEEQLGEEFTAAQERVVAGQAAQTAIDKERRRRVAAAKIEAARKELAELEKTIRGE